ncbi:MAG: hypothetical protein LUD72_13770 [Bacteroidales bacterium]|nr:hypothetical protein [Bacteroidales bacterium]
MNRLLASIFLACAFVCACNSNVSTVPQQNPAFSVERPSGHDLFFSDSLNARGLYRTYPVPNTVYTPAPKGYKPVYISEYARHGSRQLIGRGHPKSVLEVLDRAAELNCLTPLGEEVRAKIAVMDADLQFADADLTQHGVDQHRGIAERMYRNHKNVFSRKGTPVRCYSTVSQRTMMSMFSQNSRLLELNPSIVSTRRSSKALGYLKRIPEFPKDRRWRNLTKEFLDEHFDAEPLLSRLFTEGMPALKDTATFVSNLYSCATITCGMELEGIEFLWDLFTYDELYVIQQAVNYNWYVGNSNSPEMGDYMLGSMSPLLRDFIDKADAALAQDVPGADLRFGHDSYLTPFVALLGLNGFVPKEEEPLKVIDVFQTFTTAPMAGNVQMVFYRNRAGDVLVKLLLHEVEVGVPLESDIFPYYRWDELRAYFESRIDPELVEQDLSLTEW